MALSGKDRTKLARLLAMFSSDYDGEVLNAARAAELLVKRSGETWENILEAVEPPYVHKHSTHKPEYKKSYSAPDHTEEVSACKEREHLLSAWEKEFLESLMHRDTLSEKQRIRLDMIKEKLRKYEGMTW